MTTLTATFPIGKTFGHPDIPEKVTAIGYADSTNPFIPTTDQNYIFRKAFLREILAFLRSLVGTHYLSWAQQAREKHQVSLKSQPALIGRCSK
jgi:hypothetical protein